MFRNRLILAVLALVAVAPLVGCAGRRCCGREPAAYYQPPVVAAPACPAPCPPPCP